MRTSLDLMVFDDSQLFDPVTPMHYPDYQDPLHRELSAIINDNGHRPFHIERASKKVVDEQETLELIGHFSTFDGTRVNVQFSGEYGDPEDTDHWRNLTEQTSFSEFDIGAKLIGADRQQTGLFELIETTRTRSLDPGHSGFHGGSLHWNYSGSGPRKSRDGMAEIRALGKFIRFYDELHTEQVMKRFNEELKDFKQALSSRGIERYSLKFNVVENYIDDGTPCGKLGLPEFKFRASQKVKRTHLKGGRTGPRQPLLKASEFIPRASDSITPIPLQFRAVVPREVYEHFVVFEELIMQQASQVKVSVDWAFAREMKELVGKFGKKLKKPDSLPQFTRKVLTTLGFVWTFFDVDVQCEVDESYFKFDFDQYISESRQKLVEENPTYQPLYLTSSERPFLNIDPHLRHEGMMHFISIDQYLLFRDMVFVSLINPGLSVDDLLANPAVQSHLDRDSNLRTRITLFKELYKENPHTALNNFHRQDPVYNLAIEMEREERIQKELPKIG